MGPASITRRELLAALGGALLLGDAAGAAEGLARRDHFLFGSPVRLIARAGDAPLAAVLADLQRLHVQWNAWKPGGELGRLNAALREGRAAPASAALRAMIGLSARLERDSFGFFNAGIGGAVGAWGFHDDVMRAGPAPDARALRAWRDAAPSLAQLELRGGEVASRNPRLQLDFGAIAKGVAIDRALDRLHAAGVADALVDLGGNLAAIGGAMSRPWQVGIRDPHGPGVIASLATIGREAVVTSGSYERFREVDGQRVTHILDPHTAAPARQWVSVTVLHRSAAVADAAATALLVAGAARWQRVAERLGVTQVLAIDREGRGEVSAVLAPRLHFADAAARRGITIV
jgi:FAD:protein FMN transferase